MIKISQINLMKADDQPSRDRITEQEPNSPPLVSIFPDDKKRFTNKVYRVELTNNKKIVYYLPAYLRLKVKNIVDMDLFTLTGQLNCTLILSVLYSNMDQKLFDFLSNSIEIAFHKGGALVLDAKNNLEVSTKNDSDNKILKFSVRKAIRTNLQGDIFWSPFQKINFQTCITMRSLKTQIDGKRYIIKFNLMDCDNAEIKFSLAQQYNFGMFRIAQNQLDVLYTNKFSYTKHKDQKRIFNNYPTFTKEITESSYTEIPHTKISYKQIPKENKILTYSKHKIMSANDTETEPFVMKNGPGVWNFQYAHFILPVYKIPYPALITIYFPLLLLGIINISIFFQDNKSTGKIMLNIAALIVSYIALIPTVRQNTPVTPTVTFTQIMVFLESFTTLLTLAHMIEYRNMGNFDISIDDGFIVACIAITAFVALSVFVLVLFHNFYWKRQYHNRGGKPNNDVKFDHTKWSNQVCDAYFYLNFPDIQKFDDNKSSNNLKKLATKTTDGDWEQTQMRLI